MFFNHNHLIRIPQRSRTRTGTADGTGLFDDYALDSLVGGPDYAGWAGGAADFDGFGAVGAG